MQGTFGAVYRFFSTKIGLTLRIVGSVVEFSPATRETGVRFPDNASVFPIFSCVAMKTPNKDTCRNPGLNQGPSDLQSDALPTELFRLRTLTIPQHSIPTDSDIADLAMSPTRRTQRLLRVTHTCASNLACDAGEVKTRLT